MVCCWEGREGGGEERVGEGGREGMVGGRRRGWEREGASFQNCISDHRNSNK